MGYSLNLPSLVIPQLSPITQYQTHTQITFFERMNGETYLMAESEEKLKSHLMRAKEESEKAGLKLNIQKMKILSLHGK